MIKDFQLEKDRISGNITPEVLLDSLRNWIESDVDIRHMAIIYVHEDDEGYDVCEMAHTNMMLTERLGLLEWAKAVCIEAVKIENGG